MKDKTHAIEVKDVDKTFWIADEKSTSFKSYFLNPLKLFSNKGKKFEALGDLSFSVQRGEFLGIIGRNGSGKSTLLKILAGIYVPDKGSVKVNGSLIPFLELGVGFNPELTGFENIFLNGTILGMSRKYLKRKWKEIIEFAELEDFAYTPVKNYSSGMMLRLAFAIAIQSDADIYVMDEVLAVGDANFQARCIDILMDYKRRGKTIVLVSHDTHTIERFCNRAMLIRNGRVVKSGTPKEVVEEYERENVQDEEMRLQHQVINNAEKFKSTGKQVEIRDIYFINGKGERQNVFESGEDVHVRVEFDINGKLPKNKKLNFGVALFSMEGLYISGANTFNEEIDTSKQKEKGYFELIYKNLSVRSGTYYVSAGIWGANSEESFNLVPKSNNTFRISSQEEGQGLVDLDHSWN